MVVDEEDPSVPTNLVDPSVPTDSGEEAELDELIEDIIELEEEEEDPELDLVVELTEEEVDDTANDEELDLPVIDTFEDMQELLDQLLVLTNDDSVAAMGTIL